MNVLVTGGAGYIGSHTAKVLAQAGHQPVVLDNLSTGHRHNVKWGPLVELDCADESGVTEALRRYRIEAVIHFAACAYVGESMQEPRRYFTNNTAGTLGLLNAMHAAGVGNFVFSSTCATYGNPESMPISEGHSQRPVNPYGESKLFVEKMLAWLGLTENLHWCALRYFNAAGADPDGDLREEHDPEPHLIPRALNAAAGGGPLDVYGTDYPTPDGSAIRDFVHVTDLAHAHLQALQYVKNNGPVKAMNLGTGTGSSVLQVIAAVSRCSGRETKYRTCPRRPGDPSELVADPTLAKQTLGWETRYSDLDTIVETAWRWFRKLTTDPRPTGIERAK